MSNECSICLRPDRIAIDADILERSGSLRTIAKRYATSAATLIRHRDHIPKRLAKAVEVQEVAAATTLLGKVQDLEIDARRIGRTAESAGDLRTALGAIAQLVRIVELLGKVTGEIAQGNNVQVNVAYQPVIQVAQSHGLTEADVQRLIQSEIEWRALPEAKRERIAAAARAAEEERE